VSCPRLAVYGCFFVSCTVGHLEFVDSYYREYPNIFIKYIYVHGYTGLSTLRCGNPLVPTAIIPHHF